jgi:ABC-2 type transport system permease protein
MIGNQPALLKRELWEHRSIYVTPAVVALLVALLSVTGQVAVSSLDQAVDIAILGASNLGERERAAAISVVMTGVAGFFVLAMSVLTVFYTLDALYAERKDRSILFWRSLPCTDAETVLSKLLTALFVIPLVTFLAVAATHLVVLAISSAWIGIRGGSAWHLIWTAAPLVGNWTATLVFLVALPLWLSPFIGWFLFVSAFARRSPLLLGFLPILILPMLEKSLIGTSLFADAFFARTASLPLFRGMHTAHFVFPEGETPRLAEGATGSLLSLLDLSRFFGSASLWLGLIVCGIFTGAAIYVRRYRDDS